MSLSRLPIDTFFRELGSANPAPGGGAAAAVCACLGLSLYEMVLRLNARKNPAKLKQAAKVRKTTETCLRLMQKDAQAFASISKIYKSGDRGTAYQKALKVGAQVPFEIIQLAKQALSQTPSEYADTSRWLKSDLMESELLLRASIRAAALNVEINLKSITDKAFVSRMRKAMR